MSISLKATEGLINYLLFQNWKLIQLQLCQFGSLRKESHELNQKFKKLVTLTKEKKVKINIKEVASLILLLSQRDSTVSAFKVKSFLWSKSKPKRVNYGLKQHLSLYSLMQRLSIWGTESPSTPEQPATPTDNVYHHDQEGMLNCLVPRYFPSPS